MIVNEYKWLSVPELKWQMAIQSLNAKLPDYFWKMENAR
jgi:hypothetical protein